MTDGPFIISPNIKFEVNVRILGGLMALGYTVATIMKRSCVQYKDDLVTVKLDTFEGLDKTFVQVQGRVRAAVEETGRRLGLEGTFVPRSYIEQMQLEKAQLQPPEMPAEVIIRTLQSANSFHKSAGAEEGEDGDDAQSVQGGAFGGVGTPGSTGHNRMFSGGTGIGAFLQGVASEGSQGFQGYLGPGNGNGSGQGHGHGGHGPGHSPPNGEARSGSVGGSSTAAQAGIGVGVGANGGGAHQGYSSGAHVIASAPPSFYVRCADAPAIPLARPSGHLSCCWLCHESPQMKRRC